jgi:hypothetical protein
MRIALGILMILHGIAHLPGFIGSWRLAPLEGLPYETTILMGRLDLGDAGIHVIGVCWLLSALAFVIAGSGALLDREWWLVAALGGVGVSLALSLVELPAARIGGVVNLAILASLVIGRQLDALGMTR